MDVKLLGRSDTRSFKYAMVTNIFIIPNSEISDDDFYTFFLIDVEKNVFTLQIKMVLYALEPLY